MNIILIFAIIFMLSGVLAWRSLGDLHAPEIIEKIKKRKGSLFGVIKLPQVPRQREV